MKKSRPAVESTRPPSTLRTYLRCFAAHAEGSGRVAGPTIRIPPFASRDDTAWSSGAGVRGGPGSARPAVISPVARRGRPPRITNDYRSLRSDDERPVSYTHLTL